MNYLTSLRGLAAILVVFYHARYYLDLPPEHPMMLLFAQGYLAVDFFFMLSGFIIAYNYSHRFASFSWTNYGTFLWKRFARIYPLHLFVLLLYTLFPLVIYVTGRDPDYVQYPPEAFVYKLFLIDAWRTGYAISWNVPSWSISAEIFAYMAFPLLLRPFLGLRLSLVMVLTFVLLIALATLFSINGMTSIGNDIEQFGIIRCVMEFLVGIAIFYITSDTRVKKSDRGNVLIIVALAIIALGNYTDTANYWYMPLAFLLLLTGILTCNGLLHRLLEHKLLVYLGEISYSVYLTHYFVIDFMGKAFLRTGQAADARWVIACVVVTLAFSALTYRFVEIPSRRYLVAKAPIRSPLTKQ